MPGQKLLNKHQLDLLDMEPSGIPPNTSHQQLMAAEDGDSTGQSFGTSSSNDDIIKLGEEKSTCNVTAREWFTIAILCFVNLINYMDRFTIAGILPDIQAEFGINDAQGGLLQTAFVLSYMLFAPLFGYLGDRYSRKYIMAFGVALWSLTTLLGSFMPGFGGFLAFRACVGIGEASYSTIAPTIISDLFVKDLRSKMLALFYFAIPVGSGLGYIIGSQTAAAMGSWHWGLRVTPVLGFIAVLLILLVLQDPARGESEGSHMEPTDWGNDLKSLAKNPSFMLSTFGFTCVAFVAGALAWWGPKFIHSGLILQPGMSGATLDDVSFKFGVIAMVAGLIGVPLGSFLAQRLRVRWPQADPLLCATGLLLSCPFIFFGLVLADKSLVGCYLMVFFGEVALNLNWSIVADMLLYVVVPTRRSTAEAFQILVSHALGDAGSPYLVGVISDMLKGALKPPPGEAVATITSLNSTTLTTVAPDVEHPLVAFHSLQYALFTTTFVEILGGFFFLLTALYIVRDKLRCERAIAGSEQPQNLYADDSEPTR